MRLCELRSLFGQIINVTRLKLLFLSFSNLCINLPSLAHSLFRCFVILFSFSCAVQETVCLCVYEVNDDTPSDPGKTLVAKVGWLPASSITCTMLNYLQFFFWSLMH